MEYWKANDDVHKRVKQLVGQYHPDLAMVVDELVVVFRERAGNRGGQVILGTARRPPTMVNVLADTKCEFILEIGANTWEEMSNRQQEALLDHLLCGCFAEEVDGELKCRNLSPDVSAYRDNLERYGMWFPVEPSEEEQPPIDPVGELFGIE